MFLLFIKYANKNSRLAPEISSFDHVQISMHTYAAQGHKQVPRKEAGRTMEISLFKFLTCKEAF